MYLSFITGNILQKFSSDKKNIIFYPQNNLFDHTLFELEENNFYIFNNNKTNFETPNVIDLPESHIELYNYNLSMTSNIIGYSTSNLKRFHINSIIFTHSYRPHFIKKEDASILDNNLSQEIKIFFSEEARQSWGINNKAAVIKYGIPKGFHVINTNRPKDILILNFDKAIHNVQLINVLKSKGYNCDTLDSSQTNIEKINQIFNEYKICIDLADHNVINLLCSIASGCKAITLQTSMLNNEYSNIPGLHCVETPADILDTIGIIINNTEDLNKNSLHISELFNFDNFSRSIQHLINKTNQEAFVV